MLAAQVALPEDSARIAPAIDRLEPVWRLCWDGPRLDAMAGEPR